LALPRRPKLYLQFLGFLRDFSQLGHVTDSVHFSEFDADALFAILGLIAHYEAGWQRMKLLLSAPRPVSLPGGVAHISRPDLPPFTDTSIFLSLGLGTPPSANSRDICDPLIAGLLSSLNKFLVPGARRDPREVFLPQNPLRQGPARVPRPPQARAQHKFCESRLSNM
jgi:hypothetical protein